MAEDVREFFDGLPKSVTFWLIVLVVFVVLVGAYSGRKRR